TVRVTSTWPRAILSLRIRRNFISSSSLSEGMRKCRSRKRWLTDLSESAKPIWPLVCPFTWAKPVIERMGEMVIGFLGSHSSARLFHLNKLKIVKTAIGAKFLHQIIVSAYISNCSGFQADDAVGPSYRRQAVGNDDHCATRHQVLQSRLHQGFGLAV